MKKNTSLKRLWSILSIIAAIIFITLLLEMFTYKGSVIEYAIITILLLIVLILLVIISYRIKSISSQIHPHIKKHYVISLDVPKIKEKAIAGEPFSLNLGKKIIKLVVNPIPISKEGFEITEILKDSEPKRTRFEENITYAGKISASEATSDVRLTITEDRIIGYIIDDNDWWFIEPMNKFQVDVDKSQYIIYRTKDLDFKLNLANDNRAALCCCPVPGMIVHSVGPYVGIILVADKEFELQASIAQGTWWQEQMGVLNNVNGLFWKNLGCQFYITGMYLADLKSCDADVLLNELEEFIKWVYGDLRLKAVRAKVDAPEIAHLMTGKELDGNILGTSWEPGVYSLSQQQLYWVGGGGGCFGSEPNLAFQNMMIMSHEIGHSFKASHYEADEWCARTFLFWCVDHHHSLMWPTYYDDNLDWITDGVFHPGHNNRKLIKDNMATGRDGNF